MEETKRIEELNKQTKTTEHDPFYEKRMELQRKRRERKEMLRRKRLQEKIKRKKEEELKAKKLSIQKQKKEVILKQQLDALRKRRLHAKVTHLKCLKHLYKISLRTEPSYIMLQNTIYLDEKRIPDVFPKYKSIWLKMIHKILPSFSFLSVAKIGYYNELNIACPKFPDVTYYSNLTEIYEIAFKQEYEFFYKVTVDLDIDVQIYGWKDKMEFCAEESLEIEYSEKQENLKLGKVLEKLLNSDDFFEKVDLEFIRDHFGPNIQKHEEGRVY